MEKRTDYKRYEESRRWINKYHASRVAREKGYKTITECVCKLYDAGSDINEIKAFFGHTRAWVRRILIDMNRIKQFTPKPKFRLEGDLKEEFFSGYDGVQPKIDYVRNFLEKHPDIECCESNLAGKITKKKKKKKLTDNDRKNYRLMDENRSWTYYSDLKEVARNMGCEYITEAVARLNNVGFYGPDIAEKFGRNRSWALSVLDYLGLEKKPVGGTEHHGRVL